MSTNWYTTWTGGSSGNGSSCYNDDSNQNDGYEYGGENFSIGNNVGNFISNRGGFNLGYGATENYGNFRRNYEARYGEAAVSNNGENYSDNFRGGYGQRYGDNASSSNDRSNYRRNYVQTFGEGARGIDRSSYRGNYEQICGEDTRSNNRSSYGENYGQRYGEDVRNNDSINSRRNYEQRYGENVRSNDSINSRGSYEQRYGEDTRSNNRLSSRKNYGQRYGEDVRSNDSINSRGNYEQRYGEDVRSNDNINSRGNYEQRNGEDVRSNDSINSRGIYEQRYGEDVRSNDSANYRGNYEQRYEENVRSNDCANYSENFRRDFKPSFGENARDSHCGINYTGTNRERYNGHERRTDSDWTGHYNRPSGNDGQNKVEESYCSKKSIQDCLLEGSIVVVKQQRGRPKYQCLHCKITFFNEDHIEKKGHLGHVEHCLDVRDCFEATVGKRGFGPNFKKLSSQTNEGLKSKKVKTEPYQNAYEKDYIEKDIKEKSERIKQEAKEIDFRCNLGRLKDMTSQERVQNYVTNQIKEEVFSDINLEKEIIKTEIAEKNVSEINEKYHITKEEATNLVERQAQEKKIEPQKRLKEIRKILKEKKKKKMAEKNEKHHVTKEEATNMAERQAQEQKKERQKRFKEIRKTMKGKKKKKERQKRVKARERNEEKDDAIFDKEVKAVTRWDQYACLKPECLETFQVWGDARRHMRQGCLPGTRTKKRWRFTKKPNMGQSREKAQNQRGMGTPNLKPVADENEAKLVEAARNFYAEKRNRTLYPTHKQVVWHLRNTYRGFGVHPARIHQIVKSLSNP